MYLEKVEYGQITLCISPEECALLAEVCHIAAQHTPLATIERQAEQLHIETMGAMFKAGGLAARLQMQMPPSASNG